MIVLFLSFPSNSVTTSSKQILSLRLFSMDKSVISVSLFSVIAVISLIIDPRAQVRVRHWKWVAVIECERGLFY